MKFLLKIIWLDSTSYAPREFCINHWQTFQSHCTVLRIYLVDHTSYDFDMNEIKEIVITPIQ